MNSSHSIEPWVVCIAESCWSSSNLCLLTFQGWEKDLGILPDRWKSAVWLGKSDLTDEHLVRTDEGVAYARSVRRLADHSWSQENLRPVVETPQRPKTTTAEIPPVAENPSLFLVNHQKRRDAGGASGHEKSTWTVELKQSRETHRDTRECACEETIDDEITKAAGHTCFTS